MKQTKVETGDVCGKITQSIPPPPPPLPPLPRFWVRKKVTESVTKQEIAKFWRKKLTEEEDHFLAAIKAAARIRARNLSEDGYKQFEESLKDDDGAKENDTTSLNSGKDTRNNEVRVGIKDWWTKSKYAYLNQPAIKSKDPPNRRSSSYTPNLRFYSDSSNNTPPDPLPESSALAELKKKDDSDEVKDVSNKELREMMDKYFKGDGELLPSIMEAVLQRKLSRKHEETDDELMEELRMKPLSDVDAEEFQSDFDELYETDKELNDLCDAKEYVVKKMMQDQYFNMDDKKWDEMVKEAMDHGFIKDTKECEEILEDMLSWDKLLPDDIKEKVEKKFNELGDMCERREIEAEEAYELFKKFEDELVMEYVKKTEAEGPPQFDEATVPDKKKHLDDPPGMGPIIRWQTRVVFAPGGDAWHPKNRKVKMSVTVKELGLSKPQFRRLRELVGKRYHPGRDELTITSERFEHREENRKDCLRTLFALIEEAGKATKLAEEARVSYCKDRLRANPAFMVRLHSKITGQGSNTISA